jgi:hypothetical protein
VSGDYPKGNGFAPQILTIAEKHGTYNVRIFGSFSRRVRADLSSDEDENPVSTVPETLTTREGSTREIGICSGRGTLQKVQP